MQGSQRSNCKFQTITGIKRHINQLVQLLPETETISKKYWWKEKNKQEINLDTAVEAMIPFAKAKWQLFVLNVLYFLMKYVILKNIMKSLIENSKHLALEHKSISSEPKNFHQQKLSSLSFTSYLMEEGAWYTMFFVEASKILWAALNNKLCARLRVFLSFTSYSDHQHRKYDQ